MPLLPHLSSANGGLLALILTNRLLILLAKHFVSAQPLGIVVPGQVVLDAHSFCCNNPM